MLGTCFTAQQHDMVSNASMTQTKDQRQRSYGPVVEINICRIHLHNMEERSTRVFDMKEQSEEALARYIACISNSKASGCVRSLLDNCKF